MARYVPSGFGVSRTSGLRPTTSSSPSVVFSMLNRLNPILLPLIRLLSLILQLAGVRWQQLFDHNTNSYYFSDTGSGHTQWEDPRKAGEGQGLTLVHNSAQPEPLLVIEATASVHFQTQPEPF